MSVFSHPEFDGHEKLVFHHDKPSGLKLIVAIHNTNLGCALGGCRMWNYASEDEAIADVLRLSRGMTYKAAITGLNLGGGKSVIIGDPHRDKTPEMMRALGRFMNSLNGEYITAEDVGMTATDIKLIASETKYVAGFSPNSDAKGPSSYTAYGVYRGIEAAVRFKLGRTSLQGIRVAIQGVGKVGYELARLLVEAGAEVFVADIYKKNIEYAEKTLGITVVPPEKILQYPVDVVAPCAMGAVINQQTIPQLQASIVAGSANNQLAEDKDGERLSAADILYVPDYVVNSGGLIRVYYQYCSAKECLLEQDHEAIRHIDQMTQQTLPKIFIQAKELGKSTSSIADKLARERFTANKIENIDCQTSNTPISDNQHTDAA
jgi:leucine dehydrogenase